MKRRSALLLLPLSACLADAAAIREACVTEISFFCGRHPRNPRGCLLAYKDALLDPCREALSLSARKHSAPGAPILDDSSRYPAKDDVPSPDPGLTIIQRYSYLNYRASNQEEMIKRLYSSPSNINIEGWCRSTIRPLLTFESTPRECALKDARITLEFTITLPRWENPVASQPELLERVYRFVDKVKRHELVHRDIAVKQWADFLAQARSLRAANCAALQEQIANLRDRLAAEARRQNDAHDRAGQQRGDGVF